MENLRKITEQDLSGKLHVGQNDSPELGTEGMQQLLDAHPNLNTEVLNENADTQNANNTEVSQTLASLQTQVNAKAASADVATSLSLKVDKVEGKGLSTNDYDNAAVAEVAKVANKADKANVLEKDNTTAFTPTSPNQPATKEYVDSIAMSKGAVASVFGRAGHVVAQAGDYTAEQVGALSIGGGTVGELATIPNNADTVIYTAKKPQEPIKDHLGEYIAPITTADQVFDEERNQRLNVTLKQMVRIPRENLINGSLTIWQTGTTFAAPNNSYTADMFKCTGSGTAAKHSRGYGMQITGTVSVDYLMESIDYIRLPDPVILYYSVDGVVQKISKAKSQITTNSEGTATLLGVELTDCTLDWVSLYPMAPATSAAQELAGCQRYYQIGGCGYQGAWGPSTTDVFLSGIFSVSLRKEPAISLITTTVTVSETATGDITSDNASISSYRALRNAVHYIQLNGFTGRTYLKPATCMDNVFAIDARL